MKPIRLNVNIFFNVPDDYEVTDTESIEFKGEVELHGNSGVISTNLTYHETIESLDLTDLG